MRLRTQILALNLLLTTFLLLSAQEKPYVNGYAFPSASGSLSGMDLYASVTFGQSAMVGDARGGSIRLTGGFITRNVVATVNAPPFINLLPVDGATVRNELQIAAEVSDTDLDEVTLMYRSGGESDWQQLPMTPEASSSIVHVTNMQPSQVTEAGIEYRIEAHDAIGQPATAPQTGDFAVVSVRVPNGMTNDVPQPSGTNANDYRLISFPLSMTNKRVASAFADLWPYEPSKWRLWQIVPPTGSGDRRPFMEFSNDNFTIEPGRGYWLIVNGSGFRLNTGDATNISTKVDFSRELHEGFNDIGNPYSFPIPVDNLSTQSGAIGVIRTFTDHGYEVVQELSPFTGYIVESPSADMLTIHPRRSAAQQTRKTLSPWEGMDWAIRIRAENGSYADPDNMIGVANDASRLWDPFDQAEPPVIGDYVSLFFRHPEWHYWTDVFHADIRNNSEAGYTWDFEVWTSTDKEITLTFEGIEKLPYDMQAQLLDVSNNELRTMRQHHILKYTPSARRVSHRDFRIIIGNEDFRAGETENAIIVPESYELFQNYPNPFNPHTTIRYALPEETEVSLVIYNLVGNRVRGLVQSEIQHAGLYTYDWDGRDDRGRPLSTGIYICRLEIAGGLTRYRKMTFLK